MGAFYLLPLFPWPLWRELVVRSWLAGINKTSKAIGKPHWFQKNSVAVFYKQYNLAILHLYRIRSQTQSTFLLRWTACGYFCSQFIVSRHSHISEEEYSGALILVPSFSLQQNSSSIWTPGYGDAPGEEGGEVIFCALKTLSICRTLLFILICEVTWY